MIAGLFKALFLTAGPGIVIFVLAQFIRNKQWLMAYTIAVASLIFYLYTKVYYTVPPEDAKGWVFSHALVLCMVVIGGLGIFIRWYILNRKNNLSQELSVKNFK